MTKAFSSPIKQTFNPKYLLITILNNERARENLLTMYYNKCLRDTPNWVARKWEEA